ncbi:MAG: hypothetical protein RIQ89_2108 [Bacteroidota bacterium]
MKGVLLVNLGTPDSPSTSDVRKYLRQFLSDPRVIDINPLARFLLVNFIIAPFRAPKSAKLYKEVWTEKGSPLLVYSQSLAHLVQQQLGKKYHVELAMRYQQPSIDQALLKLKHCTDITILPLFPQYSSACNTSVGENVMSIISKWQIIPSIKFINSFYDDAQFLNAWIQVAKQFELSHFDHILFSFHGLPQRQLVKADDANHCLQTKNCCDTITEKNKFCYSANCHATAHTIAARLGIAKSNYTICYQSRLGRDPWVQPYTDQVLKQMAAEGKKNLLVFAPAFVADCLETIHEIGTEYDELFKEHGGQKVTLVPSLNDSPAWVDAVCNLITEPKHELSL